MNGRILTITGIDQVVLDTERRLGFQIWEIKLNGFRNPATTKPTQKINVLIKDYKDRAVIHFSDDLVIQTEVPSELTNVSLL